MSEQQRVPTGVPTGGQFSTGEKSEAGIALEPLDGSFLYPPVFTSSDDVIDFWTRVEIPDETLARAENLYRETFDSLVENFPNETWQGYGQHDWTDENPAPASDDVGATADWEGRKRAAQVDWEDSLTAAIAARPAVLNRRDVRPLVRSVAMLRTAATDLDPAGYHTVCEQPVSLTTGVVSVRDAAMRSGMLGFSNRIVEADTYDLDRPKVADEPEADTVEPVTKDDIRQIVGEVVQAAISQQNTLLDGALDELTDNLGKVGGAMIDASNPANGKKR